MSVKKLFFSISIIFATLIPVIALAQYGLEETAGAAGLAKYGTSIPGMIGNILGTALSLVGVLFFALMLFGGVMWMTARGNTENEKKALDTITAAIIGIIIVLGSYALTSFVFNNLVKGGGSTTPTPTTPTTQPVAKACKATSILFADIIELCGETDEGVCGDVDHETEGLCVSDGEACIVNPDVPEEEPDCTKFATEPTCEVAGNYGMCEWK